MNETEPKKVAERRVPVALGILCILLVAILGTAVAYYTTTINDKDNELNSQEATLNQLTTRIVNQNDTINQLTATIVDKNGTINQLESNLTNLQNQIALLTLMQHDLQNAMGNLTPYESIDFGEINVSSGQSQGFEIPDRSSPAFCGGFSVLSVYYYIDDVSDGNFTLAVSIGAVEWFNGKPGLGGEYGGPMTIEPLDSLNITIIRDSYGWSSGYAQPILIQTKAPYFVLAFSTSTDSPNWQNIWVHIRVFAYLRS
jgi:uncharacterized coiled-coil protein SlyX